jgi:hypothetical protein
MGSQVMKSYSNQNLTVTYMHEGSETNCHYFGYTTII